MASDDDVGPPEWSDDGQTAILYKKHANFTLFVCKIIPARAVLYLQLKRALL